MNRRNKFETGSALTFVLISIVLFAALSFAVSQIMSGGGGPESIPREKLKLHASEILSYGRRLQETVRQLKISNDCADTELSFENDVESGYVNASAPASCEVFGASGGRLKWISPSPDMNDGTEWLVTGAHPVVDVGSSEASTLCTARAGDARKDCVELTLVLPAVSKDLCMYINEQQNVPHDPGADTPEESGLAAAEPNTKFTGSYSATQAAFKGAAYGSRYELSGRQTGCFLQSAPGNEKYYVYYTLVAR